MKTIKLFLLIGICALAISAKAQTVTITINENTTYTGLYDVNLFVLDYFTQTYTLVGQKLDQLPSIYFSSSEIDLTVVNLLSDQVDRYRYVAIAKRQEVTGDGKGWTPLLDTGDMWLDHFISIPMN